jgi:hypothetical protein
VAEILLLLAVIALIAVLGASGFLLVMWWQERTAFRRLDQEHEAHRAASEATQKALQTEMAKLRTQVSRLAKWTVVADADEKAQELLSQARAVLAQAEADAGILTENAERQYAAKLEAAQAEAAQTTSEARAKAKALTTEAQAALATAADRAAAIIADANRKAEEIAGKAFDVVRNADLYEHTVRAMRNKIQGYGDEYLVPAESLLDELAEEFGHKDAGQQLKIAREHTRALVKTGQASKCDYVEANRREGAERFVLDAFNGKVDSILSRARHDNYGKLEQEIKDAFTLVNYGGKAFREARITDQYLAARLAELKWASVAQELKREEQEEQRRIREQIREEEKARRDVERALRESAKEEDMLRKAMAKAQAAMQAANEEQRAQYEAQLAEITARLKDAEERSQRAISMAQQTRRGHVYIISNLGSFGDDIYKIGLTRRLEPMDRIKELGDASVPFDFDVHAIILSDDAPALENRLHKHFLLNQLNKVNHRKEFFRAKLGDIRREIEAMGIVAKWTMLSEAREFRETLAIEKAIETDPAAREAWISRQLVLDPTENGFDEEESGELSSPLIQRLPTPETISAVASEP